MVPRFFVPLTIKAAYGPVWRRPGLLCKVNHCRFTNHCSALHDKQQTLLDSFFRQL